MSGEATRRARAGGATHATQRAAIALVMLALAPTGAPAEGLSGERYWQAVQTFAEGDRAGADGLLAQWDRTAFLELSRNIDDWVRKASRCEDCEDRRTLLGHPLLAAALLHTERAFSPGERPRPAELEVAYSLLKAAELGAGAPSLVRPWLLATTLRAHAKADGSLALRWAREGTSLFPHDASILLANGAVEEALCGFSSLGVKKPLDVPEVVHARLVTARSLFDAALRQQPDLHEARLRRGRVRLLLAESGGEDDLRQVESASGDPRLVYLARLFLGRRAEIRGDAPRAVAEYRAAAAAHPGRTALLALSHVLSREAAPGLSRRELERAVAEAKAATDDPFREYPWPGVRLRESERVLARRGEGRR